MIDAVFLRPFLLMRGCGANTMDMCERVDEIVIVCAIMSSIQ